MFSHSYRELDVVIFMLREETETNTGLISLFLGSCEMFSSSLRRFNHVQEEAETNTGLFSLFLGSCERRPLI